MLARCTEIFNEIGFNYDEVIKREDLKQEDVEMLHEEIKKYENIPKVIFDRYLLIFLHPSKGKVEKAARWMHKYFYFKQNSPEFFSNRDPESASLKKVFKNQLIAKLPVTPSNNFVFFYGISNYEPRNYDFDEGIKAFMMMCEIELARQGPRSGAIFLFDLKGVKFGHIFRPSIHSVRKGIEFLQYLNPINVKAIHVLNSFWFMDLVFSMIKPFVHAEFYERIHLHPIGSTYEDIYESHVPKSHMPKNLGGDLEKTITELHEESYKEILSNREYFMLEEKQMKLELDKLLNNNEEFTDWNNH